MYLKDLPDYFKAINIDKGKPGKRIDYAEYKSIIKEFIATDKPYMLVDDEEFNNDLFHPINKEILRFKTAITMLEKEEIVRSGYVKLEGKHYVCLYRRDMGY